MKKGQAAMEFLMTYGWAILVVLAAIGALAYFGVLSPGTFLPSSCTVGAGFGCTNYKASSTANDDGVIELTLRNNIGQDLNGVEIWFSGDVAACTDLAADPENVANCATDRTGASCISNAGSYDWESTAVDCSAGSGCVVGTGNTVKNGRDIMHIRFRGCTDPQDASKRLAGQVQISYNIVYTKSGETIDRTVSGEAKLKVE